MKRKRDAFYANAEATDTKVPEKAPEIDVKKIKIEYLDVMFFQIKQRDGLLGDFSADGKYAIKNEKILEALLLLPKQLQEKNDHNVYASLKIGKYVLNFRIDLDLNESYCTAALKIIEIEHRGEETIKHVQELDKVVELYSPLFLENMFKRWNVVREIPVIDKDNAVITYLKESEEGELFLRELSDILAQVYILKMLKILGISGEKGAAVAAEYKAILARLMEENPGIAQDNTKLKGILDALILKHNAFDEIIAAGGADVLKGYSKPIDNIRGKGDFVPEVMVEKKKDPVIPVMVNPAEVKKPAKKKVAKKEENKAKNNKAGAKPKKKEETKQEFSPGKMLQREDKEEVKKPEPKVEEKQEDNKEKKDGEQNKQQEEDELSGILAMLSIDQAEKMGAAQEVNKTTQMALQQNVETSSMEVVQEGKSK